MVEQDWTLEHSLLDDIRRTIAAAASKKLPPPHPLSPAGRVLAAEEAERAERREGKAAASRAREEARQQRLAEGG